VQEPATPPAEPRYHPLHHQHAGTNSLELDIEQGQHGELMQFWASDADARTDLSDEWEAAWQYDQYISCVAICDGGTYVQIHKVTREISYTGGLPLELTEFLGNRQRTGRFQPRYVALGSESRYYVEMEGGAVEPVFCGPETLQDEINKTKRGSIRTLSFGVDWETWFIVFSDGSWRYEGNVPEELLNIIYNQRGGKKDLEFVSIGPEGQYFLRTADEKRFLKIADKRILDDIDTYEVKVDGIQTVLFGGDTQTCFLRGNWRSWSN